MRKQMHRRIRINKNKRTRYFIVFYVFSHSINHGTGSMTFTCKNGVYPGVERSSEIIKESNEEYTNFNSVVTNLIELSHSDYVDYIK